MKVLITDASYDNTLAITRYLGKEGIDVYAVGESKNNAASLSKYCKGGFIGPSILHENTFVQFVIDLLKGDRFDLLIPVSYKATKLISENREIIERYTKLILPNSEKLKMTFNKNKTYHLAQKLGIPIPKTYLPNTYDDLNIIAHELKYPIVIKPQSEIGGGGSRYPKTQNEFFASYKELCEKYNFTIGSLPMIQEYISGDPYTYGLAALYQKGECKRIFMHKEIRSLPITGGSGVYLESIYDKRLKEYSIKLLDNLAWNGVALVEFKKSTLGDYVLMEINGKFWASVEIALKAGCNFPYYLCQIARGEQITYSEQYQRNLKFHFISREIEYVKKKLTAIPRIFVDTLNPTISSDFWYSDMKPSLVDIISTITSRK